MTDLPPRTAYDRIADHFSATREHPWPEVESFVAERAPDAVEDAGRDGRAVALDVGCGNGRHAALLASVADRVVGVDASRALLGVARRRANDRGYPLDPVCGDAASLPIAADVAAVALYVATIHHLRPRASRVRSLDELGRVLAPGGVALVSAWSVTHDRFDADAGFDTTVDWTLPGGRTVPRFYHVYDLAEFRADIDASRLRAVDAFRSSGNCYAVVRDATTG
jgi:SAM-dependent methyltransferase